MPRLTDDPPRLVTATTPHEISELRWAWSQLEWRHVEAQLDWFLANTSGRRDAVPRVIAAVRGDTCQGMVLARIEGVSVVPWPLPVLSRLRPRVRTAVVVPGGLRGDAHSRRALLGELAAGMRAGGYDAICLSGIEADGPERQALGEVLPATRRAPLLRPGPHWVIDLPSDYAEYRSRLSSNLRRSRGKGARALERHYGPGLELVRYPGSDAADRLLADLEAVASRSYQRAAGAGYHPAQHDALIREALPLGLCRAWVLRLNGRPAAFELGWPFEGTYFAAFTAYDPDFRADGVGGYVEQKVIADLCADPTIRLYDHGSGDYVYKRRLSNRSVPLVDAWAFAGRPRGRLMWLLRTSFELVRAAVRDARRLRAARRAMQHRGSERAADAEPAHREVRSSIGDPVQGRT